MEEAIWGLLVLGLGIGYLLVVPVLAILAFQKSRAHAEAIERLKGEIARLRVGAPPPIGQPEPSPAQPMSPEAPAVVVSPEAPASALEPEPSRFQTEAIPPAEELVPVAPPAMAQEPQPRGLEQRLGARGFVWIGGLSIALAGAFLVKYSIEEGLLTEGMRVILGIALGVAILFAGDRMRKSSTTIGQALTAAGVAVLYASLFAAIYLYHLLGPTFGFIILAALTAASIGLALRHGPFVGLVGLAGGFLTPFIVSTNEPRPLVLFGFLYLLQLGAQWLGRVRPWWYVTAIGIAGGLVWALLVAVGAGHYPDGTLIGATWLPLFLIATSATSVWLCPDLPSGQRWSPARVVALTGASISALIMTLWLGQADYSSWDWGFALILVAATMVEGRRHQHVDVASFAVSAIVVLLGFAAWHPLLPGTPDLPQELIELDRYLWAALLLGGLLTFGGFGLIRGAQHPARWATLSAAGGGLVFAIVYATLRDLDLLVPWSILCLIMSALHLGATERLNAWRSVDPSYRGAFAVHALASAAFLAAAVPLVVEDEWLAVCWSLLLPLTAWISIKLDEPWLRRSIWIGAPAVLLAVAFSGFPAGETPIFNWLLYGIGVPAASFVLTSRLARKAGDHILALALGLGGAFLGFLLVTLEIRHLFHGVVFQWARLTFAESGTLVMVWSSLGWLLLRQAERLVQPRLRIAGFILIGLALFMTVFGVWIGANPFLQDLEIAGAVLINSALYVYFGSLGVFAWIARWLLSREQPESIGRYIAVILGVVAVIDGFIGMTALNRHLFQGPVLSLWRGEIVSDAEIYGYSVAWLLYGGLLLAAALWTGRLALRHASAVVVLITILKVFFVDAAGLTGLYRVASFLGLGIVLVGFGYLYQRYVLKRA